MDLTDVSSQTSLAVISHRPLHEPRAIAASPVVARSRILARYMNGVTASFGEDRRRRHGGLEAIHGQLNGNEKGPCITALAALDGRQIARAYLLLTVDPPLPEGVAGGIMA